MFACFERFDGLFNVPVVRSHDADNVDVVALKHFSVVGVSVGFAVADGCVFNGLVDVLLVDITNRNDVTELGMLFGIPLAHAANTNTADPRAIVFGDVRKRWLTPSKIRNGRHCRTRFQKASPRQ